MVNKAKDSSESIPRFLVFGDQEKKELAIKYGLGIDAGGTYTDAVIYDFENHTVNCKNKALTTKWDFSVGIGKALSKLDNKKIRDVKLVSVSTTLATNSIVEGEGQKAGLIFMSPNADVSNSLLTHTPRAQIKGQMSIDGQEVQSIDPDEIRSVAKQMIKHNDVTAFAISGFAGALNPAHEIAVKRIVQEETGCFVSCGHELSDLLNFIVRAQTAVLNARIIPRMIKFFRELNHVLIKRGIKAPVMVVKGDGTLMSSAMAKERPVETILSGPAASVAGAKLLTGLNDAMVVDIGGTTTDTAHLIGGAVEVCKNGANVGKFKTHVKALDMQTLGLGGDSFIRWYKDKLLIGPRRVGPMVWADTQSPDGVGNALEFMESRLKTNPQSILSQIVLVAMKGKFSFEPTKEESKLYNILLKRPYAAEELVKPLNLLSASMLSTKRLEESGLVQKCGLTPTDILHINKSFKKWNSNAARRMVKLLATLSKKDPKALLVSLLKRFEKDLAKELLKKQLASDVNIYEEKETTISKYFINSILSGKNERYNINIKLKSPIIGIGAPSNYFLPNAGKKLNAKVVIPEHADVANAIGAITSHIMIKQKLSIRPDHQGLFIVEGIEGAKLYDNIDQAEAWAIQHLKISVLKMGRTAGTSNKTVKMEIRDTIVNTANGTALFLERIIKAKLYGTPDPSLKLTGSFRTYP